MVTYIIQRTKVTLSSSNTCDTCTEKIALLKCNKSSTYLIKKIKPHVLTNIVNLIFFIVFQSFVGNTDNSNQVVNTLLSPVDARFVRILPQTWQGAIGLRFDITGCAKGM